MIYQDTAQARLSLVLPATFLVCNAMDRTETAGQVLSIPPAEHLQDELQHIESAGRQDAVEAAKSVRSREFENISTWMLQQINEVTGWDISIRLTSITDAIVRALARRACRTTDTPDDFWKQAGLFAVGGYGRGELNPESDLDVMLVHRDKHIPDWLQAMYNELNTLLWDSGFNVGIAMRGLAELEHMIKDDFVTATAVLEHRILLGDGHMDQDMLDILERFRKKRQKAFLQYKIEELEERRNKTGASLFLMEPNLKTNPGCLRDVQLLYNLAFMVFGGRNLHALKELSAVRIDDVKALFQANAHLLRMRSLQHFHHQKRQDVLELRDQVRIAEQLGYAGYSRLSAVEVMMREHYHMLTRVHKMVNLLISHLNMRGLLGKRISLLRSRKVINRHFTSIAGYIYSSDRAIWKDPDAAVHIMEMFLIAHRRNLKVSLELQRHIQSNLHVLDLDTRTRADQRLAVHFMRILSEPGRVQLTLEEMHNCGFLGTYMPEFSNVSCLMQFNSYHQYTVDQHTLFALGHVDQVHRGYDRGLPEMPRILQSIRRKDLLNLGLLLHDIGKYMGRGHVQRGALMVEPIARRLHLTRDELDLVYFLVEQHVSLSDASRMRDINDPECIERFAVTVSTQERLDMLYCLTYADGKATSDKVMTGWYMSILHELYCNIREYLSNQSLPSMYGKRQRVIQELKHRNVSEADITVFLDDLPHEYAFGIEPTDAVHHFNLCQIARQGNLGFRKDTDGDTAVVDIAMQWHPNRFAEVTGVLASVGCQIIDARCWSMAGKIILYRFKIEHAISAKFGDDDWWSRLVAHLNKVREGTCDVDALLEQRVHNMAFEERAADSGFNDPAVKVEQKTSQTNSIIDVHHKDEPGSLSRIAQVISDFGCSVDYATVSTMGDIATGVFYVSRDNRKLNTEEAASIQDLIARELNVI